MPRLPLGWLQLKWQKLRFLVAVAGVMFAVILIMMQLGFRQAMFDSAVRWHERMHYDIALFATESPFIVLPRAFSRRRIYQALGVEGVASVSPVYISQALWKNPFTHESRGIFVVGFDPSEPVIDDPGLLRNLDKIRMQDVVLFDAASRPEYGPIPAVLESRPSIEVEVNGRRMTVMGLFHMGTSFGIDGSIVTSDTNFRRLFPTRTPGMISVGLIRLQPGASVLGVRDALRELLPRDVQVLTRAEFIAREQRFWDSTTPIGYVFSFGVSVGLVVGGIIVYQILFADVSEHTAEYATLKAMGYSNAFLAGIVLQQAVILAVLGYLPGALVAALLYGAAGDATRLPIQMTTGRLIVVLVLTVAMCCISGLIALRKVRSADPADVFG